MMVSKPRSENAKQAWQQQSSNSMPSPIRLGPPPRMMTCRSSAWRASPSPGSPRECRAALAEAQRMGGGAQTIGGGPAESGADRVGIIALAEIGNGDLVQPG